MGVVDKAFDSAGNIANQFGRVVGGAQDLLQSAHDKGGAKQVENQLSNYVQAYGPAATMATIAAITGGAGAAAFGAGAGAAGGAGAAEGAGSAGAAGGTGATAAGSSSAIDAAALADQSALAGQGLAGAGELSNVPALTGEFAMPAAVPQTASQLANSEANTPFMAAPVFAPQGGGAAPSSTATPAAQADGGAQAAPVGQQAVAQAAPQAAQTGGAQPAQQGMVDRILAQMKANPLGTASTALLAAPMFAGKPKMPDAAQQQNAGAQDVQATAQQLLAQYRTGALSPGQQASLDQLTNQTKNQLRQYFASIGQADSTAATQSLAQVDQQALQMKQQMLDNALQQGLQAIGISGGQFGQIAQMQLGQDRALNQAFSNFAGSLGNIAGAKSGTETTVAPTISSTQAQS